MRRGQQGARPGRPIARRGAAEDQVPPTKIGTTKAQKLEAEGAAAGLAMDLVEVRSLLQVESDELDVLKVALGIVCDNLQVVQAEGTSSLVAHAVDITARVRQLEKEDLRSGITQAFAIAH